MGRKLFPSSNGFEFLEQYLTKIYGERGSIRHNLIRYINSDLFKSGCRYVNSIEDLPEISFDEIKQLRAEIYVTRKDGALLHSQASAFLLMLNTGLREGELLGLINSDIDMENRLLHVNRTVKIVKNRRDIIGSEKYELITGKPKTKSSKRIVPLNDISIEIIESLRKERYFGENSPLVPDRSGGFTSPGCFRMKWLRLLIYAGIEHKELHSLRHTFATNLVNGRKDEDGIIHTLPIRQVADILGHSTTAITEKYYVKRDMTKLRGITNKFNF